MKFTLCIAALVSVAMAAPLVAPQAAKHANIQRAVDANAPAMSDKDGNVVPFNTAGVYLAAAAKGL